MKKKMFSRVVSSMLALAMLTPLTPAALAEEEYNGKTSYFDFDASEYEVTENRELSIKLVRHGEGNAEADVMVKVADVLSAYGEDYIVANDKGKEFEQVDGTKPELKDFIFEADNEETEEGDDSSEEETDVTEAFELPAEETEELPENSFVMPAGKVSVDVSYKETDSKPSATEKPSDSDWWFTDVPQSTWYYEPVKYAFAGGLMSGVSDTEFAPEMDITRGMFVTILHRLDGKPQPDTQYTFTDVADNAYYAEAVAWGSENGIIAGYSYTEFAPEDKITREQLAAIMHRYAKYKAYDVSVGEDTNILSYTDALDISEYAVSAMQWVCGESIVSGFEDNTLRPKANTTRAQAAAILERFIEGNNGSSETEQSFEIAPLEGEPSDYSDENNWINIPEITKDADTIYFYPTAYNEVGEDVAPICDIDNENMRKGAVDIYNKQATAFAESTNVFAPYYRQTNINALAGKSAEEFDTIQRGVQRTDMYASLDYYFENYNDGRPFIIAGHSQGAQMIKIALGEYFRAHPEYLERMVAAYPIGYSFTNEWLEENGYKFAEGADDTGVIVSWNTEGPGNKDHESSVVLPGALAINPINWKRDDTYAAKEENLGSLVINDKGEQEIVPGLNDAQIDTERGVVVCTTSDAFVPMPEIFGPASLHGQDYGLYYANIQENAKTRIDAYMNKR